MKIVFGSIIFDYQHALNIKSWKEKLDLGTYLLACLL